MMIIQYFKIKIRLHIFTHVILTIIPIYVNWKNIIKLYLQYYNFNHFDQRIK